MTRPIRRLTSGSDRVILALSVCTPALDARLVPFAEGDQSFLEADPHLVGYVLGGSI